MSPWSIASYNSNNTDLSLTKNTVVYPTAPTSPISVHLMAINDTHAANYVVQDPCYHQVNMMFANSMTLTCDQGISNADARLQFSVFL